MLILNKIKALSIDQGDKPGLVFGDDVLDYNEISQQLSKLINQLVKLNLSKKRVLIISHQSILLVLTQCALYDIGAFSLILANSSTNAEIIEMMQRFDPEFVIIDQKWKKEIKRWRKEYDLPDTLLLQKSTDFNSIEALLEIENVKNVQIPAINKDDFVTGTKTSGSTGTPKIVVYSREKAWKQLFALSSALTFTNKTVLLNQFSPHGILGKTLTLSNLLLGATTVLLDCIDLDKILDLIARYRVTHLQGYPFFYYQLLAHPNLTATKVKSLKYLGAGGDIITKKLINDFYDKTNKLIQVSYGLTEASPVTVNLTPQPSTLHSIGKPCDNVEINIVQEEGCEEGVGELFIRGGHFFNEYYNNEKENEQSRKDGWFSTGDIVNQDKDGALWFHARKKKVLICQGRKVFPKEIERKILSFDGIKMAAVTSLPKEEVGDEIYAFITETTPKQVDINKLMDHLAEQLESYKIPVKIIKKNDFPLTKTNKIDRTALMQELKNKYGY